MQTTADLTRCTKEPLYRVSRNVRATHNQDGAVLLNVQSGQMFSVNLVGSEILQLLEAGRDETSALAEISHKFGLEEKVVKADLRSFMATLMKYQLLEATGLDNSASVLESVICSSKRMTTL